MRDYGWSDQLYQSGVDLMSFDSEWLCQPCCRVMSSEQIVCDRLCQTCDLISSGPERLCQPWGLMSSERFVPERLCQPWGLMSSERLGPERLCQSWGLMSSERLGRLCQPCGGLMSSGLTDLHSQLRTVRCAGQSEYDVSSSPCC